MDIPTWASTARSSEQYRHPESQSLIDVFQGLLEGTSTPEQAAHSITATLEPLVRRSPSDLRIAAVWFIICDLARNFGGDLEVSKRLSDLLDSMKKIQVKDQHRYDIKHWGRAYWTELPAFGLSFREYGISRL
jgi:hypothetical protein